MGSIHHTLCFIIMFKACLVLFALGSAVIEASYVYGGYDSYGGHYGKAYVIPGTEPRSEPGIYKQHYMQPVYTTSYAPVYQKPVEPVYYGGHEYSAPAPVKYVSPAYGYSDKAAPVQYVSYDKGFSAPAYGPVKLADHGFSGYSGYSTPIYGNSFSHGYNGYGYSPVFQLNRPAHIQFSPSYAH